MDEKNFQLVGSELAQVAADHDAAGTADGHRRGGALLSSPSSLGPYKGAIEGGSGCSVEAEPPL